MTATPNTTASGAADLTPEIEYDCLVAWNRSVFGANQHDTVHPMYLTAFKSGYKAALTASAPVAPAPQPAAPQGDVAAWLVLADGEPHHVTPGKSDDAARLWAEDQTKCGAPYSFTFLPLCPPAAQPQRAAPQPITAAEQAAWHAGLDEERSQARALLQQGEYAPLPAWLPAETRQQMREYADATHALRVARGAAQAAHAGLADSYLNALLCYTGGFYGAAMDHGMKRAETADAIAHVEKAARALHRLATQSAPVAEDASLTQAARDVLTERQRQITAEGWSPEHDDEHDDGSLAMAASCYAVAGAYRHYEPRQDWPWDRSWWKPSLDKRRNLLKSGALILAEIERMDRAQAAQPEGGA